MKNENVRKKSPVCLLALILCIQLSACDKEAVAQMAEEKLEHAVETLAEESTQDNQAQELTIKEGVGIYEQAVDDFFAAVDARDVEAAKALFAPNVRKEVPDIDQRLERLFSFYSGQTERCERDGNTAEWSASNDYGVRTENLEDWFALVSGGTNYYCRFSYTYRDDENPNNVGIQYVDLVSEKVVCNEDFKWPEDIGIYVREDAPGDYQTARIGGFPEIYTPIDREMKKEDILKFLENSDSFLEFKARFGEPNAEQVPYCSYAYELPEENGEKRYASFLVDHKDDWKILKVRVENDVDQVALETIWETEE